MEGLIRQMTRTRAEDIRDNDRIPLETKVEVQDFGDPIEFMLRLAKDLDLKLDRPVCNFSGWDFYNGDYFATTDFVNGWNDKQVYVMLKKAVPFFRLTGDCIKQRKIIDEQPEDYEFNFEKDKISDFYLNGGHLIIDIGYIYEPTDGHRRNREFNLTISYKHGRFSLEDVKYCGTITSCDDENAKKSNKSAIRGNELEKLAQPGDFRPYLHRLLESIGGIKRERWHDPRIYLKNNVKPVSAKDIETVENARDKSNDNLSKGVIEDPLSFFQRISKELGIDLTKGIKHRYELGYPLSQKNGGLILDFALQTETAKPENSDYLKHYSSEYQISFALFLSDPKNPLESFFDLRKIPQGLRDYVSHFAILNNGKGIEKFDFATCTLKDFEEYQKNLRLQIEYSSRFKNLRDSWEPEFIANLVTDKQGEFNEIHKAGFSQIKYSHLFGDILKLHVNDYRPYLHRVLELFSGRHEPPEWHDSSIYRSQDDSRLDSFVDSSLSLLFTGEERVQMEARLADARLKMRNGYASVPKLCLGNIVMPTPGMKSVERDEFVLNASPLLVEYLHTLGVMSQEQAEAVVSRKLENYFVHRAGFQLSRGRAVEIISGLRENPDYQEGVA